MKHKPIWLIDIGNSSISVAKKFHQKIGRIKEFSDNSIPNLIDFIARGGFKYQVKCIICSVVPKNEKIIVKHLRHFKTFEYLRLGQDVPIPIRSKYKSAKKLGTDRKVNVFGALRILRPPVVIFDFGTATTVDFVSTEGVFEGGMILPGIKASLDLLHEKTALLPAVRIRPVRTFLGRDTKSGMLAGVLHGYGAMVDGLVQQFKARFGQNLKTIATGGLVDIVLRYCHRFDYVDRLLTLRSMSWVYEDWLRAKGKKRNRG